MIEPRWPALAGFLLYSPGKGMDGEGSGLPPRQLALGLVKPLPTGSTARFASGTRAGRSSAPLASAGGVLYVLAWWALDNVIDKPLEMIHKLSVKPALPRAGE